MPSEFLQALAIVLSSLITTSGMVFVGVMQIKMAKTQDRIHADVAAVKVGVDGQSDRLQAQSEKLQVLAKAAGVTEGLAIKADDIKKIVQDTKSTIENGGH